MTKVLLTEDYLDDIADAIREKLGVVTQYKPSQMAAAIGTIHGEPVLETKSVTANGTYTPSTGKDGFSEVTVNVSWGDLEALTVRLNGVYVPAAPVDGYDEVTVQVPTFSASVVADAVLLSGEQVSVVQDGVAIDTAPIYVQKTITQNGTYDPGDDNAQAYSGVVVNVQGGGGDPFAGLTAYIESSGTQYINIGYTIAANTRFEVVANVPDNSSTYPALFGARTGTSDEVVVFVEFNGGNIAMVWANGDSAFDPNFWHRGYIGTKCEYVLGAAGEIGIRDADNNGFKGTKTTGTGTSLPIYLFALNENSSPNSVTYCAAKLYRFRVYEGDALVMELLPFVDGNSVACLKDTVSENLFYNAGSGSFTYGTDA